MNHILAAGRPFWHENSLADPQPTVFPQPARRNRAAPRHEAAGMSSAIRPKMTSHRLPRPWRDRRGRVSPLRVAVLALASAPASWLLLVALGGGLGAEPWKAATREVGTYALSFLLITLAVTPLRWIADWPLAATLRRMLGLTALAYAALHLGLYLGHLGWNLPQAGWEIVTRFYLTLGFATLVGLAVLGWTSTDGWQVRLGRGWKKLHRLTYPLAAAAVLHAFLQSKAGADQASLMAGLFAWAMLWRTLSGRWRADGWALLALAPLTALATALIEAAWYAVATNLPALRILAANLDPELFRPAHLVLLAALLVAALPALRKGLR
jgi:sulfoxide reductase heme-binding subunit YedZ